MDTVVWHQPNQFSGLTLVVLAGWAGGEGHEHGVPGVSAAREVAVHARDAEYVGRDHLVLQAQGEGGRRERQVVVVVRARWVKERVQVEERAEPRRGGQVELGETGAHASIEVALDGLALLPRLGGRDELGLLDRARQVLQLTSNGFELRERGERSALVVVERVGRLGVVAAEALLESVGVREGW